MEPGSIEHKRAYRESEIKRLTESSWSNMITAHHMSKAMKELEELRAKAASEVEVKEKELEALPHGKENRERRAVLKREIDMGKRGLNHVSSRMQMLNEQIETHRDVAKRELARAKTIENEFLFTTQEIDKAMGLGADDEDDFDADAELAKIDTAKAKIGDVYQLADHRLMCGDSTNKAHITTLMDGKRADMVFTDPPYNVNYSGSGKKTSNTIMNDAMSADDFRHFLAGAFTSMRDATKDDAPAYVCYASRTHREFEDTLNLAGYQVRQQIIWVKSVASMGWGDYRWKHEPILYVVKNGSTTEFFGDRSQYTEWKDEPSDDELLKRVKKMVEKDEQGDSTVWRLKRDSNYDHPTQKPLALVKIALRNSSKRGALVLDLFGGSGSTLIASEQYGRTCYAMELDPKYVDVIIKRWEKATGLTATKIA